MNLNMPLPQRPPLRERRRHQMMRTIANAAVELFELNGVAATTADDIAAAAGISRTTFFRYSLTKESAVLVDDAGFGDELVAVARQTTAESARADLDAAWDALGSDFDEDADGYERFLRVRRLLASNPSLLAAGMQQNAALSEKVADALQAGPGLSPLDARAVAQMFSVTIQLTLDEWVRRVETGTSAVSLRDVHRDVLAALSRASDGHPT